MKNTNSNSVGKTVLKMSDIMAHNLVWSNPKLFFEVDTVIDESSVLNVIEYITKHQSEYRFGPEGVPAIVSTEKENGKTVYISLGKSQTDDVPEIILKAVKGENVVTMYEVEPSNIEPLWWF